MRRPWGESAEAHGAAGLRPRPLFPRPGSSDKAGLRESTLCSPAGLTKENVKIIKGEERNRLPNCYYDVLVVRNGILLGKQLCTIMRLIIYLP